MHDAGDRDSLGEGGCGSGQDAGENQKRQAPDKETAQGLLQGKRLRFDNGRQLQRGRSSLAWSDSGAFLPWPTRIKCRLHPCMFVHPVKTRRSCNYVPESTGKLQPENVCGPRDLCRGGRGL